MVEQIGGNHYAGQYQHWDWCIEHELGYLCGTATKYLCRWRSKGGLEDLRKSRSYVLKMLELQPRYYGTSSRTTKKVQNDAARIPGLRHGCPEHHVIWMIASAATPNELELALKRLDHLIDVNTPKDGHPAPFGYTGEDD